MHGEEKTFPDGFSSQDLFFDCPNCGKSLGIDRRGAGLIAVCTECGQRMQVPVPEDWDEDVRTPGTMTMADYTGVANAVQSPIELSRKVERLSIDMEELQKRKHWLERRQQECLERFERIRDELALIQASLDRMVNILQDYVAQPPSEDGE